MSYMLLVTEYDVHASWHPQLRYTVFMKSCNYDSHMAECALQKYLDDAMEAYS